MEDYLEAIYHLEKERRIARVRDIADRLGVKMSSVTSALKTLRSRGFVKYDPHQFITLTDRGHEKAKEIVRRHEVLKRFLSVVLQIDGPAAEDNACRLEHHLDPEVMDKLVRFVEFVETCPVDQTRWLDKLSGSCDDCLPCLDAARGKLRSRAEAQKAALDDGMTLADARMGAQVIIDSIRVPAKFRALISEQGLEKESVAMIEERDPETGAVRLNVKGYHITVKASDAAKIFVKPI
jgi:DtxR family Mn-dependent transcriptional regulator